MPINPLGSILGIRAHILLWAMPRKVQEIIKEQLLIKAKAIAINPQYAIAYNNRGNAKYGLKDYQGAIADYTMVIAINPQLALAYKNRGIAKELVGDLKGACADWRKASSLGEKDTAEWVRDQCQ